MKIKHVLFTALCLFAVSLMAPAQRKAPKKKKEAEQDGMLLAMKQEIELTKDPRLGIVPKERMLAARAVQQQRFAQQSLMRAVPGIQWEERGPNNVGGRTRALIFDRSDVTNKKVWAGGVDGGVWRCNDITAGVPAWTRIDDFWANMAVTTLAQDPSNNSVIYAGTGEGWFNADAVRGLGIWKTSNGGTTWAQLSSTNNSNFYYIQKVAVNSSGHVFACTRNAGLQKSTNGGTTWTTILANGVGGATNNEAADIEIASNGDLYCSLGTYATTGTIWKSTNGGTTWTNITPAGSWKRIELACAPTDNQKVYALLEGTGTGIGGIRRTDNGGTSWVTITLPNWCDQGSTSTDFTRNQAWYDLIAAVDPNNANTLYIGGVDVMKTTNGGTSFTQVTQWAGGCGALPVVHADIHAIVFAPSSSTNMLVGCDGGVYYTNNSGTSFAQKNNGYNVTQFYGVAMHPTNTNEFLAGAQDNGSQRFTAAGINATTQATGGDGGFPHIDQTAPSTQITSYVYNNWWVSTTGGVSWTQRFKNNNGQFINPSDYDNTSDILYSGNTGGTYFRWLTPATNGATASVTVTAFGGGSITHVSVSPTVANRVYFGLSNGRVVFVNGANTAAGTVAGTQIRAGTGSVSCVAVDPANENHILVTYSNYGVTSVWETTNLGTTWTAVEGNLPDMPVRWAMFDPRNSDWALLATELGVWSTDDLNGASTDWQPTNNNLANVRVDHFQFRASDRVIAAATHGRGLFTSKLPADLFIRDMPTDVGIEPNPDPTSVYWNSQDIWVCQSGSTCLSHANPEFGQTNTIRVRVSNRGGLASAGGGNEVLKVYWAKASTALGWTSPWNGGVIACGNPSFFMGGVVGTQNIPVIAAGGSTIMNFSWNPPNPANYACYGSDASHFCLLARIETNPVAPYGMTFPETTSLWDNVKRNNNKAWRNVTVQNLFPRVTAGTAIVSRAGVLVEGEKFSGRPSKTVNLHFTVPEEEMQDPVLNFANMYIDLTPRLHEAWLANGGKGDDIEIVIDPETRTPLVHLLTTKAVIRDVPLQPDEQIMIVLQTEQFKQIDDGKGRTLNLGLHDEREQPIGGETFVFSPPNLGDEIPIDPKKVKKLTPDRNPIVMPEIKVGVEGRTLTVITTSEVMRNYELSDLSGNVLKKGVLGNNKKIDASGIPGGMYVLNIYDNQHKLQSAKRIMIQ